MSALALGLLAALCWGIHDITIRYLSKSVPLMAALLTVLIVGAVFQASILAVLSATFVFEPRALALACGAGVAFLFANLGLYYAFERGPVRIVSPLIASYPILSILFAVASGASVSVFDWVAVLAIVIGVGLVAAVSDPAEDHSPPLGPTVVFSLISACGFAGTFKLGQLAAEVSGELPATLIARLTALVCLVLVIGYKAGPFFPGRRALIPLCIMGLLDGIALLSVISAAPLANPEYASVAASVFGMLTILLAWAFLKERMSAPQWAACLLTFAGIAFLAL
ncbi:MAG: DMT family transporter [Pseudomonadota bacterium]